MVGAGGRFQPHTAILRPGHIIGAAIETIKPHRRKHTGDDAHNARPDSSGVAAEGRRFPFAFRESGCDEYGGRF